MVTHAFIPALGKQREASGSLSSRPAWSTELFPGQAGLFTQRGPVLEEEKKGKLAERASQVTWQGGGDS